MQDFSYDPFDPAVMADPLPYYRTLRDEHPVYYIAKWDTYALSRFADIWEVLEINDGTFVASEGTLPAATVLAQHNDGPVPDPPLHPMPFHANFDAPIYDGRPPLHVGPVPAEVGRRAGRPDPRAGQRAARRAAAARHVRPDPGLRRHRRRLGGVRIGRSASRSGARRAGHRQRGQPGRSRAAASRWPTPGPATWIPDARSSSAGAPTASERPSCRSSTDCSATGCPTARR